MSRLQDFPSVTPTASDNILIVQSDGQGLASVDSTFGAKMDKANPTGTGSLSINRKSGTITGTQSTALGVDCEASGSQSFATGLRTIASGSRAHAEGQDTVAGNLSTHAEGLSSQATGSYSHAEGYKSISSGERSHAEGSDTTASGNRSHAEGTFTIASRRSQHVFGEYNIADTQGADGTVKGAYVEIVGNGSNNANRSNARTLDWSGNETLAGKLSTIGTEIGGTTNGYHYVYDANNTIVAKTTADASGGNMYCYNSSGNESVAFTTGGTGYGQFRVRNASNTAVIQGVGSTGNITCVSLTQTSDANFKDVSNEAIPDVSSIKAVRFKWKEEHKFDESEHIGYLAQDVEKVLPFLVKEDAEGNKVLDYIAFLVAKVDSLEKRISELEKGE